MQIYYCDHFVLPLPPEHRFPMAKYAHLRDRVTAAHLPNIDLCVPEAASDEQLTRVHDAAYVERVKTGTLSSREVRKIGFPWSPELVERSRRSVGGTISACHSALQDGISVNLAGGTHHAYRDSGGGYCVFNDAAVAARDMQARGHARRILIIDCDVHQGNGTAAIFAGDASVFTFSLHGAKNYPFYKETGSLDIELPDGTTDTHYLDLLDEGLQRILAQFNPDMAIYLAGADPFHHDRLGRLAVTKFGLVKRDHLVFNYCLNSKLPIAVVMAGGYAPNIDDIVDIHFQTVRLAAQFARH